MFIYSVYTQQIVVVFLLPQWSSKASHSLFSRLCLCSRVDRLEVTEKVHCNFTQVSHQICCAKSHSGAFTLEQSLALAEVTSMSAQFIISRPLTLLVYGPRIKKAHSKHTEKGKQSTVRALNIQLERGGTEAK